MAYSRISKIIGGALGAGILGLGCYHTARRVRGHANQNQDDAENVHIAQSDNSRISFDAAHFQQTVRVGLAASRFVYDTYQRFFHEIEEIPVEWDVRVVQPQVAPYDPDAGGDTVRNGPNEPSPIRREGNGCGDAPQNIQELVEWGEDAPPPF